MKCIGRFKQIFIDYGRHKQLITLEVDNDIRKEYESLAKKEKLAVEIKQYRPGRSLNANKYMWVLLQKMAEALHTTKDELYLEMLDRYGQFTYLIVKPTAADRMKKEWRTVREIGSIMVNGEEAVQLQCYYGSSTYDTREMSILIDGIVSECHELGIETLTPDEIEEMKQKWGVLVGEKAVEHIHQ